MELNGIKYDTYKIQRLFFKYIRDTELQNLKITPQMLADELLSHGFIWVSEDGKRYAELPKFLEFVGSGSFKRLYTKPNSLLHDFVRRLSQGQRPY